MYESSKPKKTVEINFMDISKKIQARQKYRLLYDLHLNRQYCTFPRILGHSEIHRAFAFLSATTSMTFPMTRTTGTTTMRPSPARGCWLQVQQKPWPLFQVEWVCTIHTLSTKPRKTFRNISLCKEAYFDGECENQLNKSSDICPRPPCLIITKKTKQKLKIIDQNRISFMNQIIIISLN